MGWKIFNKLHTVYTIEVGVLYGDDARLGEDLLGEVVDQLPVDETRDACRVVGRGGGEIERGRQKIRIKQDKRR